MLHIGCRIDCDGVQRGAQGILDHEPRGAIRIVWKPGPTGQAAGRRRDEALNLADDRCLQRAAQQVLSIKADGDVLGVAPTFG